MYLIDYLNNYQTDLEKKIYHKYNNELIFDFNNFWLESYRLLATSIWTGYKFDIWITVKFKRSI